MTAALVALGLAWALLVGLRRTRRLEVAPAGGQ